MNLVMFDIDGTLTQTCAVDAACYVEAVMEVTGLRAISTDWASYRHTTDSGILDEIYRSRLERPPREDEIRAVRGLFVQKLQRAISGSSAASAMVKGAQEFIEHLRAGGHAVSLASGGWRESALLKLAAAKLPFAQMPAAFADDALSRCEIMSCSYRRACVVQGVTGFDHTVYIGDGAWDAKASQSLGYPFIGVGAGEGARLLSELGAIATLCDYANLAAALEKIRFAFGSGQNASRV